MSVTDLERADALLYALLMEDDAPRQEAMLARALAAARREGAEEATLRAENAEATAYAWADADAFRRGAEEMRERAARLVFYEKSLNGDLDDVADAIRALPLTPEER